MKKRGTKQMKKKKKRKNSDFNTGTYFLYNTREKKISKLGFAVIILILIFYFSFVLEFHP